MMCPETVTHVLHEPLLPIAVIAVLAALGLSTLAIWANRSYGRGYAHGVSDVRSYIGLDARPHVVQALRNAALDRRASS